MAEDRRAKRSDDLDAREELERELRVERRLDAARRRDVAMVTDDLVGIPDRRGRAGVMDLSQGLDEQTEHRLFGEFARRNWSAVDEAKDDAARLRVGGEHFGTDADGRRETSSDDLVGPVDTEQVRVGARDSHDDSLVA